MTTKEKGNELILPKTYSEFFPKNYVKKKKTSFEEYIPTKKNGMVKDLYESMGFEKKEDGSFILNMEAYVPQKVYIKEI